jgi:hypothetical protein
VVLAREKRYSDAQKELTVGLSHLNDLLSLRPRDGDALYTSEMTRNHLSALERCTAGRACPAAQVMRLPIPNN